jgi:predicted dehydrogenase
VTSSAGDPVRFGFLAAGRIAAIVASAAAASDRIALAAVAARERTRAETFAREHGFERAYGTYDELLADPDVECVYVSTPNSLHVDWTVRALEAGKHVLCEKPFSRRPAEAERAVAAARHAGRLLAEGFMYRHLPLTGLVARLVREGELGPLRLIRASWTIQAHEGHVGLRPELDGGALMVVGCYCVNASRLLGGEPESVYGEQVVGPTGVDTSFAAMLRFPGGAVGQLYCALFGARQGAVEVQGEHAALYVADPWFGAAPVVELHRNGRVERIEANGGDPYRLELEHVSAAIRGESGRGSPRDDVLAQARVLEALYRSAEERRPVTVGG